MLTIRTFCISLPESPERKAKAQAHFRERQVDCQFFDGIHAERFGLQTIFPYEVDNPGSKFNIGFKCVGIWLSHYFLWGALNLLWEDSFMVLEDDAKFEPDWHPRLINALKNTPEDYDMLYIGSCCAHTSPRRLISAQVWEVKYPLCTHAYIVRKKALPVLLRTQRKVYAPIDISMAFHSMPELKVYTILPRLVDQFDTVIKP